MLVEVPQQARALNGTVLGDVSQHARALRGRVLGDLPQRDRALQAGSSSGATLQRIDLGGDLVECEGKDLWEWVQCRRHGNLLEEEIAAKPTCQSFHVEPCHCNLATGSTCEVPS